MALLQSAKSDSMKELNKIDLKPSVQIVILGKDDNTIKVIKEDPPLKHLASSSNGQLKSYEIPVPHVAEGKSHEEVESGASETSVNLDDAGGLPTTAKKVTKQKQKIAKRKSKKKAKKKTIKK